MKTRSNCLLIMFMILGRMACLQAQEDTSSNDAGGSEIITLSPFTVDAQGDRGYGSINSMGASRIAQSNLDVSGSVITLSEQLFQDTAATEATEVLGYASGVQLTSDRVPGHTQYTLRGYALGGVSLRDGLPDPADAKDIPLDESSSYERLEIIKGPAGTLYGSHSMGGIVNKVSKWPRYEASTTLEFQAQGGFEEYFRGLIDTTGPLGPDSHTAYRATLSYTDGDRHYDESDAPWKFLNTTLMVDHSIGKKRQGHIWGRFRYFDYELDRENGWQYITGYLTPGATSAPTVENPVFAIGKSANIVPEDDISLGDVRTYEAGYEQTFEAFGDSKWTLRLIGRHSNASGDKSPSYAQGRPVPVDADGNIVTYVNAGGDTVNGDNRFVSANDPRVADWRASLTLRDFRGFAEDTGFFVDLVGEFNTGGAKHTLVLNTNVAESEDERAFFFWGVANPNDPTVIGNTFSAIDPDFTGISAQTIPENNAKSFNRFQGNATGEVFSWGFQDNISFMEGRLIFTAGARYDDSETTNRRFDSAASLEADRFIVDESLTTVSQADNWSFKYGGVFKIAKGVSLFGQLSQTFNPISSVDENGNANPDQEGEMAEVGLKFEVWDGRFVATASYFDMELTNVLISVINPIELGGGTVLRPVGVQESDGFELDMALEPIDGWTMLFAFSDLTSTSATGLFFRGVPTDANYSLMTKYQVQGEGGLAGLFAGLGWQHNGRAPGDSTNTFFWPESDRVDVFFGYEQKRWSVQLNVYNINGTDAVVSSVSDRLASRQPDTHYRFSARYKF